MTHIPLNFTRTIIAFMFLFNLCIACYAYADGVTIMTHGWNPSIGGAPVWLESLRNAVSKNYLGDEQNYGKITVTKSGNNLVATCDPWNFDLTVGSSGEILIILDWSEVADHLFGGPPAQDVAAIIIDKIVSSQNNKAPLAELPIHLIGHSRGGGMVCEIARLLGEKGIVVDHLTPLDPHPLTSNDLQPIFSSIIDTPTAIYENVVFADNYLQNTEYPKGEFISGAYNRAWETMSGGYYDNYSAYPNHRNVYLMYQGTVNLNNPVNNGEAVMDSQERSAWFTTEESNGDKSGFCFSRIKGTINRKKDGINDNQLLGGTGVRQNLMWSEAVWPNIADLQILKDGSALGYGNYTVSIGTELDLRYVALDYDSSSTVTLHADSDQNPYNSNDLTSINDPIQHIATNELFIEKSVNWDTSGMNNGTKAYIYAKISDASRTRYFYAPTCLVFSSNISPVISNLYFPHVSTKNSWETEVCIINTSNSKNLTGNLIAYNNAGVQVTYKSISLGANARVEYTVGSDFLYSSDIGYMIFESDSADVCGYMKFFINTLYRAAIPATSDINSTDIHISHIASNTTWWTDINLLNTTNASKTLTIEFSDGTTRTRTIAANEHQVFSIKSLFSEVSQPNIKSAVIKNANGIVGLELVGNNAGTGDNYLSGALLKDDTTHNLYFPHIGSINNWWTGIVAYNLSGVTAMLIITPYREDGTVLTAQTANLGPGIKYVRTDQTINLPEGAAWFHISSTQALTGFQVFGTNDRKQLGGYASVNISRIRGVFPKIEKNGWTGIALVNIANSSATVTLTAYDDNGDVIDTENFLLSAHEKKVSLVENIFSQDISAATYISFSSGNAIVGFQLNGSTDSMMLDALPGM